MQVIPVTDIKPNPSNPRLIKDDKFHKLVQSLKDFPEMAKVRPIVVNQDMVILGGNMRFKAMKEAKWKEIPVEVVDWDEGKQREFIIKDNVGFGEWDWDDLANNWDAEELDAWGLDVPVGFIEEPEAEEDDYVMPDEIQTDIVLGDLFEIGEHRLLCGDSTQTDTFKVLFGEQLADLVVTDPPYNVAYEGKTKKKLTIENDSMRDGDFYQFLYDFYTALGSFTKAGGSWYVWHADSEGANFRKAMADAGIMVKQCLIWVKQTMVMGRQDYQWKHEPCLYGWKEGAAHGWYSDRKQTTVLEFDRPSRNAEHPTMKPIPLFAYQIGNSSKQGDIVADGFGGSGTTMVACHQMNRKAYLVEFDPKYCQVIVDRMLKLDPTLKIKRNGQPYLTEGTLQGQNKDAKTGES
jgi:site-specific DNA-methyltransferase (adenine-specific)